MVAHAVSMGLAAIAVTDHDTMRGVIPVMEEARNLQASKGVTLRVVAGVEISTAAGSTDLHILGYGADPGDGPFIAELDRFRDARAERAEEMVQKLRSLGVNITMEEVRAVAGEGAIGRPHVATVLRDRGYVSNMGEAFARFIGYEGPAYVPKLKLTPAEGIALLRGAGAVPVLAHPGTTRRDELIPELAEQGLMGLEVVHSRHSIDLQKYYRKIAAKHNLIATGGSDSHGRRDTPEPLLGKFVVPFETVTELDRLSEGLRKNS
jgi:predicted metal-dependent phosphoesterase TrpH